MIGYIKGKLKYKEAKCATFMTAGGVGYRIFLPQNTLDSIVMEDECEFFIETIVREDALSLFGFKEKVELDLFRLLIDVNKVGPKLALAVLSAIPASEIVTSILSGNSKIFEAVSGLGKKTAEKIIIDLKDKVTAIEIKGETQKAKGKESLALVEAEEGLVALGFNQFAVRSVLAKITLSDTMSAEAIVREALRIINENKR